MTAAREQSACPERLAPSFVEESRRGQVLEATAHLVVFDPLGSGIDPFGLLLAEELRPPARLG